MDENNGAQSEPTSDSSQVPPSQEDGASSPAEEEDKKKPAFGGLTELIAEEEKKVSNRGKQPATAPLPADGEPVTREVEPDTPEGEPPTREKEPETEDSAVGPAQLGVPEGSEAETERNRSTTVIAKQEGEDASASAEPPQRGRSGTAIIEKPPEAEAQGQQATETSEMPPARKVPDAPPWRDIGPPRLARDIAAELSWPPPPSRKKIPVLVLALTGVILVLLIFTIVVLFIILQKRKSSRDFSALTERGLTEIKFGNPVQAKKHFEDAKKVLPQHAGEVEPLIALATELEAFYKLVSEKRLDEARSSLARATQVLDAIRPRTSDEYLKAYREKIGEGGAAPAPEPAPAPAVPAPAAP